MLLLNHVIHSAMWIKTIQYPQLLLTAGTGLEGLIDTTGYFKQ